MEEERDGVQRREINRNGKRDRDKMIYGEKDTNIHTDIHKMRLTAI